MNSSEVCPTEDAIVALLESLVDPKLPSRSSVKATPSQLNQEAVAKQIHAVVLLYNYYHRKRHPHLELLGLESFCKVASMARPTLLAYMKLMQLSDDIELNDPEKQLSLTEKRVMYACDISTSLHESVDTPSIQEWPISKVAVFLVDSKEENCFLQFGGTVEGVWSVIERDACDIHNNSASTGESKNLYKRKKVLKQRDESGTDEVGLRQLAFSAVKEVTGIGQSVLKILENHIVYSLSVERTTTCIYIMQCTQPKKNDLIQVPIKNAIDSLQGPLFQKISEQWFPTPVVEYFLLLPYAGILSNWVSRKRHPCKIQVQQEGPEKGLEEIRAAETPRTGKVSITNVEHLEGRTNLQLLKQNDQNSHLGSNMIIDSAKDSERGECCTVNLSDQLQIPQDMRLDDPSPGHNKNEGKAAKVANEVRLDDKRNSSSTEKCVKGSGNAHNKLILGSGRSNIFNGSKNDNNNSGDRDGVLKRAQPLMTHCSSSNEIGKLCCVIASKDKELTQTALKVLLSKRDKLSFLQRDIEDQIAQCDKNIQAILNGGENEVALKIEALIDGCSDIPLRGITREIVYQCSNDQLVSPCLKRKRFQDNQLNTRSSCQDLDDVCYKNNWILPTYHVSLLNGEFKAKVTVKGMDFECSTDGELSPHPHEARESAAAQMLTKLAGMPSRK